MDKYKFYIETENLQEIRKKGLLYSKILTVFLLFIPLMICSQANWSVITKLIIFGLCWFIFPFVTFSMGYNLNNYRFQTQFPSLLSVPMAALTIYLSLETGEFPPTPVSTFQVLMLAFLTIAATHMVHYAMIFVVDNLLSPKSTVTFTTKVIQKYKSAKNNHNGMEYQVIFNNHFLEEDHSHFRHSASLYDEVEVGDVIELTIKSLIINKMGSYIKQIKKVDNFEGETDYDILKAESERDGSFRQNQLQQSSHYVAITPYLILATIIVVIINGILSRSDFCSRFNTIIPQYTHFILPIISGVILVLCYEYFKLRRLVGPNHEAIGVWSDFLTMKFSFYGLLITLLFTASINLYNRYSEKKGEYSITTTFTKEARHIKTQNGEWDKYTLTFDHNGQQWIFEPEYFDTTATQLRVSFSKGLLGEDWVTDFSYMTE